MEPIEFKGRIGFPQPFGYFYNSLKGKILSNTYMIENIKEVFSIILPLLILFQWYANRAKEDTIKNNLFAMRRMIDRMKGTVPILTNKADDLIDYLDGTLATLGVSNYFVARIEMIIKKIKMRNIEEARKELDILSTEKIT